VITQTKKRKKTKTGQVRILGIDAIRPSPENEKLYRPVRPEDPEVQALACSIRDRGIQEPLLIDRDGWIISGHRRYVAARLAGRTQIPCRISNVSRLKTPDKFLILLRECNRQRVKSRDEQLREEIISIDPEEAHRVLRKFREEQSEVSADTIRLRGEKLRAEISDAKLPFLNAVILVLNERRKFWPLSDRSIHYALLNDPPLRHGSKPDSTYTNTPACYKDLSDLLTRARIAGQIPMNAIADPTRPVVTWQVHENVQDFLRKELDEFLKGFYRDLMQSQPNHIEIVGEKNTIGSIIRSVAMEYCIPFTLGRGFCSLPPRNDMVVRFEASGKENLILLVLSDFDPDGEEIAHSFARSLRDDFDIQNIVPIKIALTAEQVQDFELPPQMKAKVTSPNYDRFLEQHGDDVFELEALAPEDLQQLLRDAIDSVIDINAYNHEIEHEEQDAVYLEGVRRRTQRALAEVLDGGLDA
jgi:hypothetical protein